MVLTSDKKAGGSQSDTSGSLFCVVLCNHCIYNLYRSDDKGTPRTSFNAVLRGWKMFIIMPLSWWLILAVVLAVTLGPIWIVLRLLEGVSSGRLEGETPLSAWLILLFAFVGLILLLCLPMCGVRIFR